MSQKHDKNFAEGYGARLQTNKLPHWLCLTKGQVGHSQQTIGIAEMLLYVLVWNFLSNVIQYLKSKTKYSE